MNYVKIGKLPEETVEFFYDEIMKRKTTEDYQFVWFDEYLYSKFMEIFENTELRVRRISSKSMPNQKVFYSNPGYGFKIHKDGWNNKGALNIAIACNAGDWVRWYDEVLVNSFGEVIPTEVWAKSRNVDTIVDYENFPYVDELKTEVGDVYVLDTGKYHSFKCEGNNPRLILQTKFEGMPDFDSLLQSLLKRSFNNLIPK